ncbi:hypothetical protein GCM10010377_68480 [Streptomyces viridiviolaceus]|uniref:Uncharacterized protein n=1 Tax=Streptomyces viridiviolaceus TaxID=68282 RepID=A0ABW2E7T8_9ACTN|nr:hypothetical protein [Streptomyces viridiviolaceus]GHB67870.1 hypothetical protein GCM10010377_68480 [Streptomyces viridiviolaceus]
MPRKRPGRVRTKNTNRRAPLLLSTMAPEDFNVRPGEVKTIACPDCRTWRRIMGDTVLKIREHCISDKVADGEKHVTCPGSNQLVVIDIDVRRWQARQNRLLRDAMPQENRRAARQFYKPLPAPAAPVARIHAGVTLETARRAYLAHLEECVRCGTGQHCTHGGALAHRYVLVRNEEPARREARKQTAPDARKAQWTQRGGTTVETANNQCRPRQDGTVSEFRGPQVPTAPLRINA